MTNLVQNVVEHLPQDIEKSDPLKNRNLLKKLQLRALLGGPVNRSVERKCSLCADLLLRKLVHVDNACPNCSIREDIQISSGGLASNVSISCKGGDKVLQKYGQHENSYNMPQLSGRHPSTLICLLFPDDCYRLF